MSVCVCVCVCVCVHVCVHACMSVYMSVCCIRVNHRVIIQLVDLLKGL